MSTSELPVPEVQEKADAVGPDDGSEAPPSRVLSAADALLKLRAGEALEDVRVERLVLRGEFPEPVRLRNVCLVQPRFDGAVFQKEVAFQKCTIERPICGKTCEFHQGLSLSGSTMVKAQLLRFNVRGTLACDNLHTRGIFEVCQCVFEGRVTFWDARFHGWLDFKKCEFRGEADFRSFHADEGVNFKECQFLADALFRGSAVSKKLDFGQSRFEGVLDLSKAKLHDYTYLEAIQQGPRQRFAFSNIVGDRVRVNTSQLEGRLASEEKGDYQTAMHEYAYLKVVFQALHRYDEEDWAFYRFKVSQRRSRPRSWLRPWTRLTQFGDWLLLDKGCAYCTHPFRAVRCALVLILGFALIYMAGIEQFNLEAAKLPFPGEATDPANRVTIGLFKSVAVFTAGLSSVNDVARGWMNAPLIVEALLGTLLWGLFIVAFSRKIIR